MWKRLWQEIKAWWHDRDRQFEVQVIVAIRILENKGVKTTSHNIGKQVYRQEYDREPDGSWFAEFHMPTFGKVARVLDRLENNGFIESYVGGFLSISGRNVPQYYYRLSKDAYG